MCRQVLQKRDADEKQKKIDQEEALKKNRSERIARMEAWKVALPGRRGAGEPARGVPSDNLGVELPPRAV